VANRIDLNADVGEAFGAAARRDVAGALVALLDGPVDARAGPWDNLWRWARS